jgi:hypothetical protein
MKVLIACEFSGIVRDAFIEKGHDAWSCDLLPTESPGPHIQGDVLHWLDRDWDLLIAHPPCTRLSNSGVMWLKERNLWKEMEDGARFFNEFLFSNINKIAVENPIMHKYAIKAGPGRRQDQLIQPYMFGHPERKATCLWLKGLPKLKETNNVKSEMEALPKNQAQRIHHTPPSKDRWKIRSRTFPGIAKAMADQWG